MKEEVRNRLLTIAISGLALVGFLFIALSIFLKTENSNYLIAGLFSLVLASIFLIVKYLYSNKKEK